MTPVIDAKISLDVEKRSTAMQVQRAAEIRVTAEVRGRDGVADDHRNPMFKTARGVGIAQLSNLSYAPTANRIRFNFLKVP